MRKINKLGLSALVVLSLASTAMAKEVGTVLVLSEKDVNVNSLNPYRPVFDYGVNTGTPGVLVAVNSGAVLDEGGTVPPTIKPTAVSALSLAADGTLVVNTAGGPVNCGRFVETKKEYKDGINALVDGNSCVFSHSWIWGQGEITIKAKSRKGEYLYDRSAGERYFVYSGLCAFKNVERIEQVSTGYDSTPVKYQDLVIVAHDSLE